MDSAMSQHVFHELVDKHGEPVKDYPAGPDELIPAVVDGAGFRSDGTFIVRVRLTEWENPHEDPHQGGYFDGSYR
jgi:hypothetical protein